MLQRRMTGGECMKTAAVIAEYNPFHNGHRYQLECARKKCGADYVVVLLCGDYTQRGEPAMIDKYSRTRAALVSGADLVIGMQVSTAVSGAERYAGGAVSELNALGAVDYLCFGSECGDTGKLEETAGFLDMPPAEYTERVGIYLKQGYTYARARQQALDDMAADPGRSAQCPDPKILKGPNNILGIEYIRALKKTGSRIRPVTVLRTGAGHDSSEHRGDIASASILRKYITEGDIDTAADFMPDYQTRLIRAAYGTGCPVTADDFSLLLHDRIIRSSAEELAGYYESSQGIAARIKRKEAAFTGYTEFARLLKSKEMTYSRISRILMHIVLGIREQPGETGYIRVLGFRKSAQPLLHEISVRSEVPVITKVADAEKDLSGEALREFRQDILSAGIYNNIILDKFGTVMRDEYRVQFPVLDI